MDLIRQSYVNGDLSTALDDSSDITMVDAIEFE